MSPARRGGIGWKVGGKVGGKWVAWQKIGWKKWAVCTRIGPKDEVGVVYLFRVTFLFLDTRDYYKFAFID